MKLLDHPTLTWGFKAEADPGTAGRAIAYPRGRVLGGSSSINGMVYVAANPRTSTIGPNSATGVGPGRPAAFFREAENWEGDADAGPWQRRARYSLQDRGHAAAVPEAIGRAADFGLEYPRVTTCRGTARATAIGWVQQTRGGRQAGQCGTSYPAPGDEAARTSTSSPMLSFTASCSMAHVRSVEYSRGGTVETGRWRRPSDPCQPAQSDRRTFLQLSGIGDPEHLDGSAFVHHRLPGLAGTCRTTFLRGSPAM